MTRLILALAALSHVVDSAGKVPSCPEAEFQVVNETSREESDAELDDVTWTSSLLLIGFVVTSMGILFLVNCFNLHIRKASWNLLSTTASIFAAASFDFSIYRLIQLPFGTSEHNMESQWGFVIALGLWCLAVFAIVHTMLLNCDQRHCLEAGTTLGSHIYAFASILVFGNMQKWHCTPSRPLTTTTTTTQKWHGTQKWKIIWVWSVPVLAFCVMVLMFFVFFRQCHRNKMKKMKNQLEATREMQIEASAITVAFLLVQALCFTLSEPDDEQYTMDFENSFEKRFMPITHGSPGRHIDYAWLVLFVAAFVSVGLSLIWSTYLKRGCAVFCRGCPDFSHPCTDFIEKLLSVSACWCVQRGGIMLLFGMVWNRMCWYLHEIHCKGNHLHCDSMAHMDEVQAANRAQILNAYVMSFFAVSILCISIKVFQKADDTQDADAASGLRLVMSGLGVLVGICWDKAFETAYETVLEEKSINNLMAQEDDVYKWVHGNPKMAKFCVVVVGISLSIFVVLPWYWYILPHAMKEAEAHEKDKDAQQRTYDALATPTASHKEEVEFQLSSQSESE